MIATARNQSLSTVSHWEDVDTVAFGATLLAWDGRRDPNGIRQQRLYRLAAGRFVVCEQQREAGGSSDRQAGISCWELDVDSARTLYDQLRVHASLDENHFSLSTTFQQPADRY
jgi:hypothetical protein